MDIFTLEFAGVKSQTFENGHHAVVIDTKLNIIHDPNPNQLALQLNPDDILSFLATRLFIHDKNGNLLTKKEWDESRKK